MGRSRPPLRVIDAGTVSAFRSQSLWHGVAQAMAAGAAPVLSLCRPASAYVGLGFHSPLADVDLEACRRRGLPVIRRQIGGGAVWIDSDQLFFQITLSAERAPAAVDRLYRRLLAPALAAFRELGLDARLRGVNDLAAGDRGDRKISGTGAGRIGAAVTVVGNVIFRFPPERMVEVLDLPSPHFRRACLALMRRHVASLADLGLGAVTFADARAALIRAYAAGLGLTAREDALAPAEEAAARRWEERFADPEWQAGSTASGVAGGGEPVRRAVKICAGVWLYAAREASAESAGAASLEAAVIEGRIESVTLCIPGTNGTAAAIGRQLTGQPAAPAAIAARLAAFGEPGRRVAALLAPAARLS